MSSLLKKIKGALLPPEFTRIIRFVLDQCLPPLLRDCKWFMKLPMMLVFSKSHKEIMEFKERVPTITTEEYVQVYEKTAADHIQRRTDLNAASIARILESIVGSSVLDVGCGRGFLVNRIAEHFSEKTGGERMSITGTDHIIPDDLKNSPTAQFLAADAAALPFDDKSFDTVLCTHVLEHVLDFDAVVRELRRVARKRLIIVVPLQRPYKYSFDLHIRFFPYPHSFLFAMRPLEKEKFICEVVGGELYFMEERDG